MEFSVLVKISQIRFPNFVQHVILCRNAHISTLLAAGSPGTHGLSLVTQFTDLTEACQDKEGKPINYILNEDNPALYVSIDPRHPIKSFNKRFGKVEQSKLFGSIADSGGGGGSGDGGRIDILQVRMREKWLNWFIGC